MDISIYRVIEALGWWLIINFGLLMWWFLAIVFMHDFVYRVHTKWFKMSRETFDAIHYAGIAFFKILVLVFNAIPYIVLKMIT